MRRRREAYLKSHSKIYSIRIKTLLFQLLKMSFIDDFTEDMRILTHEPHILTTNDIGESKPSYPTQTTIKAILVPRGEITDDTQAFNNQLFYSQSTHLVFYDHRDYTLHRQDKILDELGTTYYIVFIEP